MAKALANQGANIVALARRQDKIEAVAKEINKQFGVDTLAVKCDITDTEAVKAAVQQALDHFSRIDILINNAGTGAIAPAEDITDEQFANEVNVDLFGTFKVAREVAKQAMIQLYCGMVFYRVIHFTDKLKPSTDKLSSCYINVKFFKKSVKCCDALKPFPKKL